MTICIEDAMAIVGRCLTGEWFTANSGSGAESRADYGAASSVASGGRLEEARRAPLARSSQPRCQEVAGRFLESQPARLTLANYPNLLFTLLQKRAQLARTDSVRAAASPVAELSACRCAARACAPDAPACWRRLRPLRELAPNLLLCNQGQVRSDSTFASHNTFN